MSFFYYQLNFRIVTALMIILILISGYFLLEETLIYRRNKRFLKIEMAIKRKLELTDEYSNLIGVKEKEESYLDSLESRLFHENQIYQLVDSIQRLLDSQSSQAAIFKLEDYEEVEPYSIQNIKIIFQGNYQQTVNLLSSIVANYPLKNIKYKIGVENGELRSLISLKVYLKSRK